MEIILLIVLLGTTLTIFELSGIRFILGLLFLLALIVVGLIALIPAYNDKNAGWGFLGAVCFGALFSLMLIHRKTGMMNKTMLITAFFAALGFFIGMAKLKVAPHMEEESHEEPAPTETAEVSTTFTPGKYIASSSGTTYHKPTCTWAKKIKEERQVWFGSEAEAKKDYKPHSCLK
tara:strand:+ start:1267 stop:1794 length:528 start_codon:yes stop_codon:yes gene_type:complete